MRVIKTYPYKNKTTGKDDNIALMEFEDGIENGVTRLYYVVTPSQNDDWKVFNGKGLEFPDKLDDAEKYFDYLISTTGQTGIVVGKDMDLKMLNICHDIDKGKYNDILKAPIVNGKVQIKVNKHNVLDKYKFWRRK